jgi:hypothetical protein
MKDEIKPRQVAVVECFVYAGEFQGEPMIGVVINKMVGVYSDAGSERNHGALK